MSDGFYFLPTTANRLLKIYLSDGSIAESVETDSTLGNLLAYRDQIISQGAEGLSAYYQTEPLRQVVAQRLGQNAEDSWALARKAELLLHDGKHGEALEVFQLAYQLNPEDDAIRSSLVRSLLSALRDDFAANRRFADKLDSLISLPEERTDFYRSMAVGLKQEGQFQQAADYFIRLTSMDGTGEFGAPQGDLRNMVRVSDQVLVHRTRWLRVQIQQLLDVADQEVAKSINDLVQARYDLVMTTGSLSRLRQFVEHFGDHPLGVQARLQLAQRLLAAKQYLAAEVELVGLQTAAEPAIAASATGLLLKLMIANNKLEEAAHYAQQLMTQWGDVATLDGPTGQQLAQSALADDTVRQWTQSPVTWRTGKCEVEKLNRRTLSSYSRLIPISVNDIRGPFPRHHTVVYNQNKNTVVVTDSLGRQTNQVLLGERLVSVAPGTMSVFGHLLVVNIGYSVMAVDTLGADNQDEPVRWTDDLGGSVMLNARSRPTSSKTISRKWGPARVIPADNTQRPLGLIGPVTKFGVILQKSQELTCQDALSGEKIWVRSGVTPGCDIFGDDQYLFIVPPDSNEAMVLNTADGSELGRREVGSRTDRWITTGRFALTCHDTGRELQLRLFDAWQQEDVWRRSIDDQSQCWQPSRDEVAFLQPDGKFEIVQLSTGQSIIDCQLSAPKSLQNLYVLPGNDSYTVIASGERPPSSEARIGIYGTIGSDLCPEINGDIYTIDTATGKPLWDEPARIFEHYMPLDQPAQGPTLFFIQNVRRPMPNVPNRSEYKASIIVLDKRNGRQLFAEQDLDRLLSYQIEANPEQQQMVLQTNTDQFIFTFTDQPAEPTEPLRMEVEQTNASKAASNVGKIANKILDAFIKDPKAKPEAQKQPNAPPADPAPDKAGSPRKRRKSDLTARMGQANTTRLFPRSEPAARAVSIGKPIFDYSGCGPSSEMSGAVRPESRQAEAAGSGHSGEAVNKFAGPRHLHSIRKDRFWQ